MKKFKEFLKVKKNLQITKKPKYGYRKIKKCLAPCLIAFSMVIPNFSASATEKNLENNGWIKNSVGWWYKYSDGSYPANEWGQINGEWYWFDESGYMQTGWKEIAGTWYYFTESGAMAHDTWIDGTYYVSSNGSMLTNAWTPDGYMVDENGSWIQEGWEQNSTGWWYKNSDGSYPVNEWKQINGEWYWFDESGYMQTGWKEIAGTWYYFTESGAMAHDTWIDGTYYVSSNGSMLTNTTTPDGYRVDENGAWINNYYPSINDKVKEEYVDIEDSKLLKVINKNISKDRADGQKVTKKEMENLKELSIFLKEDGSADFSENANESILGTPQNLKDTADFKFMVSRGIKSIKGLEYAKNLEKLKINENEISDITPLKNLTKLKYLEIQRNRITDVSALKDLKKLEFLKLYNNLITDVTPLAGLENLTGLDLHFNVKQTKVDGKKVSSGGITDISCLKDLKKLTFLDVSANNISNVDVILNFSNLKDLDFSGNKVSDYSKIADFITPMIAKQLNEANGSCGFFGQTVSLDNEVEVNNNNVKVKSPFTGIKEFGIKLKDAFEADEDVNIFTNITTDKKGIEASYDVEKNEFNFNFSDEFLEQNKNKEVITNLKLEYNGWQWNLNNVKFNIKEKKDEKVLLELNGSNIKSDVTGKIKKGTKVTLTLSPDAKYRPQFLTINDKDVTADLKEKKVGEHKYEYTYELEVNENTEVRVGYERFSELELVGEGLTLISPNSNKMQKGTQYQVQIKPPKGKTLKSLMVKYFDKQTNKDVEFNALGQVTKNIFTYNLDTCSTITAEYMDITANPESDFTFDKTTQTITDYAYNGQKDVIIPKTIGGVEVKHIGEWAFNNKGLNSVVIPEGVETIGEQAFMSNGISELVLPTTIKSLGSGAFAENLIEKLTIPKTLDKFGAGAFMGNKLKSFTLPETMTEIPRRLLERNELESIIITKSVTEIKEKAFYKNKLKGKVEIPEKVKFVDNLAFANNNLTEVNFENTSAKYRPNVFDNGIKTNVKQNENYVVPKESDFEFDKNTKAITAYKGSDFNIEIPKTIEGVQVEKIEAPSPKHSWDLPGEPVFKSKGLNKVKIPEGVKVIGEETFADNSLTEVILPESLEKIGKNAFNSNNLVSIKLPKRLTTLEENVFRNNKLTAIDLTNIKEIKKGALADNNLTNVDLPKDLREINDEILQNNNLTGINIPKKVKIIGKSAFTSNKITEINIPESVEIISEGAFASNGIKNLSVPENVKTIGKSAFAFNGMESLEVKGKTEILNKAFYTNAISNLNLSDDVLLKEGEIFQFNRLKEVKIPKATKKLPHLVFAANQIKNVIFHDKLEEIGYGSLYVNKIENLEIPDNVKIIGEAAFFNNHIKKLKLPKTITTIENGVFRLNKLTQVEIPKSVKEIKKGAFKENKIGEISINSDVKLADDSFDSGVKINKKVEGKAVVFGDENLKNTLLTMFKNYDGKDGLSDTIEGEYEFKLKDPNYRIDKNATELYEKDLEQIEGLALRGFTVDENSDQHPYEFKSIVGLEKAKNLKQLTISSGNIPEEESEDFKNKIYYSKGSFSDLTPLKNLKNLELLRLSHNNIEDISILKELSNLKHLYLSHNKIKDISPLKTLKNLESLDISKNNVENPDIIKNFKNLRLLALRDSNISNLDFLKELTSLESLTAGENKISDISTLKNLTNLKELYIDKNNIFDFSILKNLKKLTTSTLGNQEIESNLKIDVKEKTFEIENPFNIEDVRKEGEKITLTTDNKDIKAEFDKDKNVLKVTLDDEILKQKQVKFNINIEFTNKFPFYGDYSKEKITLKNIILNIKKEDEKLSLTDKQKEFYFELFNYYSKFDKKYKYLTDDANKNFTKDKKPKLDKNFTKEDFKMLKTFSISKENVTDELIEPLKYAENLEEFSVLLNNGKLKREVTDFSFLKNTPKLKKFYYANQDYKHDNKEKLEKIDFSNNKNLKDVRITNTDLKNLNSLKGLDLNSLSFEDNEISDISSIKEMKNLERIDLDNNKIESVGNNLDNCQNLITLYLRDNPIEDISFLGKLKNIEALHLRNTNIKDISILKKLPNLHRLYIDKCKKLPKDYFNIVKELKGINTLFVSNITKEDFEWLKTFAIRDKVDASFDEDRIRLIGFENLSIDISVKKTDIVNNKITIDNPLKGFDGNFVEDAGDERGENKNKDLKFSNDKIEITLDPTQTKIPKKYSMYLEDYNNTFGDYSQPANISGSITLNVVVK